MKNESMETNENFISRDINLISAILTTGQVTIINVATRTDGAVYFELSPRKIAEDLSNQFYNGKLTVAARDLFNRQREVKDMMFQNKDSGRGQ